MKRKHSTIMDPQNDRGPRHCSSDGHRRRPLLPPTPSPAQNYTIERNRVRSVSTHRCRFRPPTRSLFVSEALAMYEKRAWHPFERAHERLVERESRVSNRGSAPSVVPYSAQCPNDQGSPRSTSLPPLVTPTDRHTSWPIMDGSTPLPICIGVDEVGRGTSHALARLLTTTSFLSSFLLTCYVSVSICVCLRVSDIVAGGTYLNSDHPYAPRHPSPRRSPKQHPPTTTHAHKRM